MMDQRASAQGARAQAGLDRSSGPYRVLPSSARHGGEHERQQRPRLPPLQALVDGCLRAGWDWAEGGEGGAHEG